MPIIHFLDYRTFSVVHNTVELFRRRSQRLHTIGPCHEESVSALQRNVLCKQLPQILQAKNLFLWTMCGWLQKHQRFIKRSGHCIAGVTKYRAVARKRAKWDTLNTPNLSLLGDIFHRPQTCPQRLTGRQKITDMLHASCILLQRQLRKWNHTVH